MVRAMTGQVTEASNSHIPGAMPRYTEVRITFSRETLEGFKSGLKKKMRNDSSERFYGKKET